MAVKAKGGSGALKREHQAGPRKPLPLVKAPIPDLFGVATENQGPRPRLIDKRMVKG